MGVKAVARVVLVRRVGVGARRVCARAAGSHRRPQAAAAAKAAAAAEDRSRAQVARRAARPSAARRCGARCRRRGWTPAGAAVRRRRRGGAGGGRGAGRVGRGNAADPLVELLAAGASAPRAAAALDALAKLGDGGALTRAAAFEVLDLYTGNRTPDLRQRAVKALGAIRDARAVPTLIARLGDAAPNVRATAGEALAARRETEGGAAPVRAGQERRPGRGRPAGGAGDAGLVPHIAELAGSVDDGVLATTLGEYVKRRDVPNKLRVDVAEDGRGPAGRGGDDGADRIHRGGAGQGRSAVEERSAEVARRAGDERNDARARGAALLPGDRALARWRSLSRRARRARTSGPATPATWRRRWRACSRRPTTARNLAVLVLGGTGGPRLAAYDLAGSRVCCGRSPPRSRPGSCWGADVLVHGSKPAAGGGAASSSRAISATAPCCGSSRSPPRSAWPATTPIRKSVYMVVQTGATRGAWQPGRRGRARRARRDGALAPPAAVGPRRRARRRATGWSRCRSIRNT